MSADMKPLRAVTESHSVSAQTFGQEAIRAIKAGLHIRANDMAKTAAHFAQRAIWEATKGEGR